MAAPPVLCRSLTPTRAHARRRGAGKGWRAHAWDTSSLGKWPRGGVLCVAETRPGSSRRLGPDSGPGITLCGGLLGGHLGTEAGGLVRGPVPGVRAAVPPPHWALHPAAPCPWPRTAGGAALAGAEVAARGTHPEGGQPDLRGGDRPLAREILVFCPQRPQLDAAPRGPLQTTVGVASVKFPPSLNYCATGSSRGSRFAVFPLRRLGSRVSPGAESSRVFSSVLGRSRGMTFARGD